MELLTLKKLKEMSPNSIIARGESLITHPWFNSNPENLVNERGEKDKNGNIKEWRICW
jgi:hypothetical protein